MSKSEKKEKPKRSYILRAALSIMVIFTLISSFNSYLEAEECRLECESYVQANRGVEAAIQKDQDLLDGRAEGENQDPDTIKRFDELLELKARQEGYAYPDEHIYFFQRVENN